MELKIKYHDEEYTIAIHPSDTRDIAEIIEDEVVLTEWRECKSRQMCETCPCKIDGEFEQFSCAMYPEQVEGKVVEALDWELL